MLVKCATLTIDLMYMNFINIYFVIGKFGVVYKGFYTTKEDTLIEVAIKTVKGVTYKLVCTYNLIPSVFVL